MSTFPGAPGSADEDASLAHCVDDALGALGRLELDPDQEPRAANPHVGQRLERAQKRRADLAHALDQALVVEHVEHGQRGLRGDRVPAEGAEHASLRREPLNQFAASYHRRHRVAVAHRLAEGDHVGLQAVPLEGPQVPAEPAVPGLDLVRDEQPSRCSRLLGH